MTGVHNPTAPAVLTTAPVRKVMLYSHDTYGLGHLRRNLRIAGHLLGVAPGLQVVLVSGSPVAASFPVPQGLTVVKLPPVRKVAAEEYRPLNPALAISLVRRARTAIIVDVARRFRPDVLLVDHSPSGMSGELLDVFAALGEHSPATRLVLGLRDILDDPATVVRTWTEQGIYRLLDQAYDQVVVYGSRDVFDIGRQYRLPFALAGKLSYAGYIAPEPRPEGPVAPLASSVGPYLLATAGGGGDGAAVLAAAMEAAAYLGMAIKVVTGPLIDDEAFEVMRAQADRTPGAELVKFHPQMQSAMAGASAIITMGGYNSLCEAVSSGVPTIVVPRSHPRLEQTIRAGIFAERGLVSVVAAGPDLGARVARAVSAAPLRPWVDRPVDLGGLDRLGRLLLGRAAGAGHGPACLDLQELGERLPA